MDQKTFREKILSDPFADEPQILEAADADKELRELLFTARGVEAGIKDLLAAVPVPASLYGKLVTLPDDSEDGMADENNDFKSPIGNSSSYIATARAAAQQYRLAILIALIIAIAASLSIFLPAPAP